jgi:L-ascorbate oxidase
MLNMDLIKEFDKNGTLRRNFVKPPIKDSVSLPINGYTIIRFYANNPGLWPLHCHLAMVIFHKRIQLKNLS